MGCNCKKNGAKKTRFRVTYADGRVRTFSNENAANQAVRQNPGATKASVAVT